MSTSHWRLAVNRNWQVLVSYLKRISITRVDKAFDGVQGLEKFKSKPPGYYSMILVSPPSPSPLSPNGLAQSNFL